MKRARNRMRRHLVRTLRADEGSTLPLIIFSAALALALIIVVVSVTSLYVERKRLFTLADGAALDAAESFSLHDVRRTDAGFRPTLDSGDVRGAVEKYLHDNPHDEFTQLRVERAGTADGRSATVQLSAYWSPPMVTLWAPRGIRIEVTAVARSVFS